MQYFVPKQDLSIDETLVGFKAHNPIRQFLPNKHHARFRTRIWVLDMCMRRQNLTNPVELMRRNQLHNMPEHLRNSKPNVGERIYYQKTNFFNNVV